MNMMAHRQLPPSAQEAAIARASGQLLSRYAQNKAPLKLRVTDGDQAEPIELPGRCRHTADGYPGGHGRGAGGHDHP